MSKTSTSDFHEDNLMSVILPKIGNGSADADCGRAIQKLVGLCAQTMKPGKMTVTLHVRPDSDRGCMMIRAEVDSKPPKLPMPSSQMHTGNQGQLLTQTDFILGGGRSEKPAPLAASADPAPSSASGRHKVVAAPVLEPVAAAPALKPMAGKDAAAGKE